MNVTGRFVLCVRAIADNDVDEDGEPNSFLRALDLWLADSEVAYKPTEALFDQALRGIADSGDILEECANIEMRNWHREMLASLQTLMAQGRSQGYSAAYGIPPAGQLITSMTSPVLDDTQSTSSPPPAIAKWIKLRDSIVFTQGPRHAKVSQLADWFQHRQA